MKYLPVFLLIGGAVLISLVGFIIFNLRSRAPEASKGKEEVVKELSIDETPYVTLTPNSVGNKLVLKISKIPPSVSVIEYELVYNTAANVTQGVPGSVDVEGKTTLDRELALGTCSSGVCRYDKGVKDVKLSLKLKDSKSKLVAKFSTLVEFLTGATSLTHSGGKFSLILDKKGSGYYTVMETYGLPGKAPGSVSSGPYGVFTSGNSKQGGTITLSGGIIYQWEPNSWKEVSGGKVKTPGTFIAVQ